MNYETDPERVILKHRTKLADSIRSAFNTMTQLPPVFTAAIESWTRSGMVRDLMVQHAKQNFDGVPGAEWHTSRKLTVLNLECLVNCRFKKLSPNLQPSNVPTQQSVAFVRQLELPGLPPAIVNVDIGYVSNKTRTGFASIMAAYRDACGTMHCFRLDDQPAQAPMTAARPQVQKDAKPRIKRKTGGVKKDGLSESGQ